MDIKHIAFACRKEADADRFYGGLLGLRKSERKDIPGAITLPLFGVHGGIAAFNYTGPGVQFEIFISDDPAEYSSRITHVCLAVKDPDALAARAEAAGFTVLRVPRGDGFVLFLEDADGRRFEIKRSAP